MRWAEQQRHSFIEERLKAGQMINRSDLMAKFGISTPQASIDLRNFQRLHPGSMRYDSSKKSYYRGYAPKDGARDTTAAAKALMYADDAWLKEVALRDPSMIRDVAAALIYERDH